MSRSEVAWPVHCWAQSYVGTPTAEPALDNVLHGNIFLSVHDQDPNMKRDPVDKCLALKKENMRWECFTPLQIIKRKEC